MNDKREEVAARRANAFKDEMGPEETVNPLARGLSSATFFFFSQHRS